MQDIFFVLLDHLTHSESVLNKVLLKPVLGGLSGIKCYICTDSNTHSQLISCLWFFGASLLSKDFSSDSLYYF